jgi:hypothetical protein
MEDISSCLDIHLQAANVEQAENVEADISTHAAEQHVNILEVHCTS